MGRWVVRTAGLVVLAVLVLLPALMWGQSEGADVAEDATITAYDADFVLDGGGRLSVTETLQVDLPFGKHGIFRFFDLADPGDSRVRLEPRDITVLRDGRAEDFEVLTEGRGRYKNIRIGSAARTIEGPHTYVIRYRIDGAISSTGDRAQFYWNLVPGGWRMPIGRTTLRVGLPAASGQVRCAVGAGARSGCTAQGAGSTRLEVDTGPLLPNTPVTIRTPLDLPAPDRPRETWPLRLDAVLGTSVLGVAVILLLAAGAAWAGDRLAATTREPKPPFPLMYAPPDGLGPAQARYLFTERVGREAFVASIMQTGEKGATTLSHQDGWKITDTRDADGWRQLDPISMYAAQVLGVEGGSFTADTSVSSGRILKDALEKLDAATKDWARQNGLITAAGIGSLGGMIVILGGLVTGYLALISPFGVSLLALVPGLFVLFALEVLLPGSSTKRTATGRDLWSRIGGFRRVLATPSAEDRFDFSGRQELYTAYIPWAVAFGVADEWAQKYRTEVGQEPPSPRYLGAMGPGYTSGGFASAMADDFSATVGSAISAYDATQRSSSSGGGGGFSGGGGGGGGGGGSW